MATINRAPLVSCDCCHRNVEKERPVKWRSHEEWYNPAGYGLVVVSSTAVTPGEESADGIKLEDVCPACLREIADAVNRARDVIRQRVAERR